MIVVTAESELTPDGLSPYYCKFVLWSLPICASLLTYDSFGSFLGLPATVISVIMAVYQLIYAAIFTDGFEVTCKQYRESLLKEIQGVGNIVPAIKARLSCAAIFDFMDFLVESISYERRRYGRINTAACLYITLILSWFILFAWIIISIINVVNLRRTRSARVWKSKKTRRFLYHTTTAQLPYSLLMITQHSAPLIY